jgi:hypothetical protein
MGRHPSGGAWTSAGHSDGDHIGMAAAARDGRMAVAHRCSSRGRRQRRCGVDDDLAQHGLTSVVLHIGKETVRQKRCAQTEVRR